MRKLTLYPVFSFFFLLVCSICILELISPFLVGSFIPWMNQHLSLSSLTFKVAFISIFLLSACLIALTSGWKKSLKNAFVFISVVLLYRLNVIPHDWVFTSYGNFNQLGWNIAYVDLLMLYPLLIATVVFIRRGCSKLPCKQAESDKNKKLRPSLEEAISCSDEDKFGFKADVVELIKTIDTRQIKRQALVVGLRGAWGSGKTSYLNLIKEEVRKNNEYIHHYRLVEFSPWLSTSVEQLTQDFFYSFYQAIEEKPIQIRLQRYARRIVRADINWFSRLLDLFSYQSTKQMYEDFKTILSDEKTRYLVLIDDLDRLDADEILRVIQLIRNIADFPNVVFLVAYDEDYVLKQLQGRIGETREDSQFYLQKIFTIPHYLPLKKSEKLLVINQSYIARILGIEEEGMHYEQIQFFLEDIGYALSLRESVLVANKTAQAIQRVKAQSGYTVCVYDALLLNLLQLINSGVYEGLYKSYTMKPESKGALLLGELDLLELHDGKTFLDKSFEARQAESLAQGNSKSLTKGTGKKYIGFSERLEKHANEHRVEECSHILQLMFGKIDKKDTSINPIRKTERIEDNYRIKHKEVFAAYFENVLPRDIITQEEFDKMLASGKLFEYSLKKWVVEVNRSLLFRLLRNIQFENDEQGLSLLYASLTLVSGKYIDRYGSQNSILVLIGIDKYQQVLDKRNAMSGSGVSLDEENTYLNLYTDTILTFFRTIDNSENIRAKKMNLLSACIHYEKTFDILLRIYTKDKDKDKDKDTETFIKDMYKPYIEVYLENTISCSNYNKIYLWPVHKMYGENKEELASLFKEHIRKYIISFIENFSISKLEKSNLITNLFETNKSGYLDWKDWKEGFRDFLDSFPSEIKNDSRFKAYREEFYQYLYPSRGFEK